MCSLEDRIRLNGVLNFKDGKKVTFPTNGLMRWMLTSKSLKRIIK